MKKTKKDYKKWLVIDIGVYMELKKKRKEKRQEIDIVICLKNKQKSKRISEKLNS